jgi:hypothetical protein
VPFNGGGSSGGGVGGATHRELGRGPARRWSASNGPAATLVDDVHAGDTKQGRGGADWWAPTTVSGAAG